MSSTYLRPIFIICFAGLYLLSLANARAEKIVASARDQLTWGTRYDPSYVRLSYPNGDVAKTAGVCTDVVVRSLRAAGFDLQKLIHEDMKIAWKQYPRYKSHPRPDPNIDHRRVPNHLVFFKRYGRSLPIETTNAPAKTWRPGDIIYWKLDNGLDHCGIVTDRIGRSGLPMVIHNLSQPMEEDCLSRWKIVGHFRFPK